MKKYIAVLALAVTACVSSAYADSNYGWKPVTDAKGKVTGMENAGEQGGVLALSCNASSHKLNLTYSLNGKMYDLFVFRSFGVTNMADHSNKGKFVVGAEQTTQSDVFYNILTSDKAFIIARFPVGSQAALNKAAETGSVPNVQQEGDEYFLAGEGWKPLLKAISNECPLSKNDNDPIF